MNEAIATIEKKVQERKCTNKGAHDILFAMANFLEERYPKRTVISYAINEKVVLESRQLIESLKIRNAADALHIVIASKAVCSYFISADKELNMKVMLSRLGITPVDVQEPREVSKFMEENSTP